jgi:hypothetical protein
MRNEKCEIEGVLSFFVSRFLRYCRAHETFAVNYFIDKLLKPIKIC